ncbi:PREDICTED: uncharacterized protein LOC105457422 [Wasmannia auropunctata]|uniref:uncharacterized protein LOC105457422 n=1 Tax=Wasmannia auropunctata TaxID=64793 RepID=UPI0005EFD2B0|nr:PREDICTED: uncharacterized protein LOC105457422 [Wasmannia auropunctata]
MTKQCELCGAKWSKNCNVSFHLIPKDPVLRKKWVDACKLQKFIKHPDKLSSIKICSAHFEANSYVPNNNSNNYRFLKPDAVPSLNIEENHNLDEEEIEAVDTSEQLLCYVELQSQYLLNQSSDKTADLNDKNNDKVEDLNDLYDENTILLMEKTEESDNENSHNENAEQEISGWFTPINEITDDDDNITNTSSVRKTDRKIRQSAHFGQLTEEHFDSLKSRQIYLALMNKKLKEKEMKIRNLKKQNMRLSQKVEFYSKLVATFKGKKLITIEAARELLETGTPVLDALIKRKLELELEDKQKLEYTEDLQAFAITLHYYSSKAYNYVRQTFNNLLPNSRTIKKWMTDPGSPVSPGPTQQVSDDEVMFNDDTEENH